MRLFKPGAVRVKICGITNEGDALMCADAGADALGFNFFNGSKRRIDPKDSLEWIGRLEGLADRVAVVVNPAPDLLAVLLGSGCFEMVQFHGDETPAQCAAAGWPCWIKAVRVKDAGSLQSALEFDSPQLLLDAWAANAYGGTGQTANWELIAAQDFGGRSVVLAGGLTPENVGAAIRTVKPDAVDVAGGVESVPRHKDPDLVAEFLYAVRAAH
jgi:phosphoribosylanthranilate isomerase